MMIALMTRLVHVDIMKERAPCWAYFRNHASFHVPYISLCCSQKNANLQPFRKLLASIFVNIYYKSSIRSLLE